MTIAYFLHVDGPAGQHEKLQVWADEVFGPALANSAEGIRIEAYTPQSVEDPYLGVEANKLLIVQADFATRNQLEAAMANPLVADALTAMPNDGDFQVTAEAFTVRHFPLLDGSISTQRAPVSFVVRYYPPIEKEKAFNEHYFDHHPPIMAHFPRIRNILCYVPIDWQDANHVTPSHSFLGNEIVFDSIEDLNAALASDVRHDLRADYYLFPPHEGENSHHAMHRRVLRF
jgi:uncharacterized protein (TIGR02118 family)